MAHVFVSYSAQDRAFALRLADDLEKMFPVWIDREGLEGGVDWQNRIEQAVRECAVFLVVVSPNSNESDWVNRETILAEQLKKFRVPVLLAGSMPFRLLDLQYVDFQGEYAGGLRDLVEALSQQIDPFQQREAEANQLLGAGIRAYIRGDQVEADALIQRAIAFQPDIAETAGAFWRRLLGQPGGPSADLWMDDIRIVERARQAGETYPDGAQMVEWWLYLDAPEMALDQIDTVKYTLYSTFPVPEQTVRDRQTHFRLIQRGWGTFNIPVEIRFKDGSVGRTEHMLMFRTV
jgi:hypothetical protein